jgi:hypothetical protein
MEKINIQEIQNDINDLKEGLSVSTDTGEREMFQSKIDELETILANNAIDKVSEPAHKNDTGKYLTDKVKEALVKPIVSIGQLSDKDVRELNLAVKYGILDKGTGGPYPKLKTVYAHAGFDFQKNRQENVAAAMNIVEIEKNIKEKSTKPASTITGQDKINSEVRSLLNSKGLNRHLYTKSDFNLLAQYTGDTKTQEETSDGYLWDYFTPDEVVKLCWQLAYKYGFRATESRRILENSCGVGRFLRYAPDYCQVTAYELDETSYMIAKLLYPKFNIINKSFESAFYIEQGLRGIAYKPVYDTYNLVIGNPPYMYPYTSVYKDKEKIVYPFIQSLEQLFIIRGIDSLEKNGLLIYIVPAAIIDNNNSYQEFKDALFKKCKMLDAIRLPSGTFKNTDITTDLLILQKS